MPSLVGSEMCIRDSLYPWAVNFRDYVMMNPESFRAMCIFIGILLVAYLYALGKGALNWHHDPR